MWLWNFDKLPKLIRLSPNLHPARIARCKDENFSALQGFYYPNYPTRYIGGTTKNTVLAILMINHRKDRNFSALQESHHPKCPTSL